MDLWISFGALAAAFAVLFKSADIFVDSAVSIAAALRVPKMLVGIVLVAMATTAPEFAVSFQSALIGHPEIALGNAVGSVICDDGLAFALAAIVASAPLAIDRHLLRTTAPFLIGIDVLAYLLALNGSFGRWEGGILVLLLAVYLYWLYYGEKKRRRSTTYVMSEIPASLSPLKTAGLFLLGLIGVIGCSRVVIWSAIRIAEHFGAPEAIMGLTLVAIGTSLPEVSTCITAARKGHGEIAAGNIIGADIFNILWILGASAVANPIHIAQRTIHFSFPWMLAIVFTMLGFMRMGFSVGRYKGAILLGMYIVYGIMAAKIFY
jgi:cation:H+ antiporter